MKFILYNYDKKYYNIICQKKIRIICIIYKKCVNIKSGREKIGGRSNRLKGVSFYY